TLRIVAQVCDAVQYAHHRGVIHRDLKPSNILIDSDGNPKVLDFGLAKQLLGPVDTIVSLTQEVIGTLPYMSPEQAKGNPDHIDMRTDVYALGVILYETLTGHYPYPVAGNVAEVLKHIAETPPTPPSRQWTPDSGVTKRSSRHLRAGKCPIDDELQTVILKTLAKERERRYQSAGDLAKDISHYLANEPIEAKRDSGWYVLRKTIQKFKAAFTIGTLFLLIIVTALVVSTTSWRREKEQRQIAQAATELAVSFHKTMIRAGEVLESIMESHVDPASRPYLANAIVLLGSVPSDEELEKFVVDVEVERVIGEYNDEADEARRLVEEGSELMFRQRYRQAHAKLDEALRLDPNRYKAIGYKAYLLREEYVLGDFKFRDPEVLRESLMFCDRALAIKPTTAGLWNLRGALLISLGELEDAEKALRRALKEKPNYYPAHTNLCKALALQDKIEAALDTALDGARENQREEAKDKYDDGIWRVVGTLQLYLHDAQALDSLKTAIEIDRKDQRNRLMLARLYLTLDQHRDDQAALEQAKMADALTSLNDPRFKRILAQALLKNAQYLDALTQAEAAIERSQPKRQSKPQSAQGEPAYGLPAYSHLIASIAASQIGDREKAGQHLQLAKDTWPAEFKAGKEVIITAEKELLWFDTAAELKSLRAEAQLLLNSEPR
ncbi:MAG: protein kinase, partial [Planctomycetes bacterium]|nr:protein kinase [Planctomycetota bacterium]